MKPTPIHIDLDQGGKVTRYTVTALEDMTVRDWLAITSPPLSTDMVDRTEVLVELLHRLTKAPKDALANVPAKGVHKLLDAMEGEMVKASKARTKAQTGKPPSSFEFNGETYIVPQDPENEMTFGQAESLDKVLLAQCKTDSEGYAAILAVMCLKEGEVFSTAILKDRMALFMDLPVLTAFDVCAFFFACSERLRQSLLHIVSLSASSLKLRAGLDRPSTSNSTAPFLTYEGQLA